MVIFDQPEVIQTTRVNLASLPFKARIRTIPGNFFKDNFGRGYDATLMVNVIHCNREKKNRSLIQKVHRCLKKGGRIIIVNQLQDEAVGGNAEFSLFTFLMYNTFLYSPVEVAQWLTEEGFGMIETISLKPSKYTAIVGHKL
jgi:SAM-dependent methyltransferase